jgi:predicted DNA-binding ribbon-helix-helix protein
VIPELAFWLSPLQALGREPKARVTTLIDELYFEKWELLNIINLCLHNH